MQFFMIVILRGSLCFLSKNIPCPTQLAIIYILKHWRPISAGFWWSCLIGIHAVFHSEDSWSTCLQMNWCMLTRYKLKEEYKKYKYSVGEELSNVGRFYLRPFSECRSSSGSTPSVRLSVRPSVRPSVRLSVCSQHFWVPSSCHL